MNILLTTHVKEVLLTILILLLLIGSLVVAMTTLPTKKQKQEWDEDSRH